MGQTASVHATVLKALKNRLTQSIPNVRDLEAHSSGDALWGRWFARHQGPFGNLSSPRHKPRLPGRSRAPPLSGSSSSVGPLISGGDQGTLNPRRLLSAMLRMRPSRATKLLIVTHLPW